MLLKHLPFLLFLWPLQSTAKTTTELPLLISATLEASQQQLVSSPVTGSWMIQLKWLAPEQSVVKAGDPIAVFEAGSLSQSLIILEDDLHRQQEELQQTLQQQHLLVLEATSELIRHQLLFKKAQLDAAIPLTHLSRYDYDQYQLQLQRERTETEQAIQILEQAKRTERQELTKKQLLLSQTREKLQLARQQVQQLRVVAAHDGLVSYADHPWYGTKLATGTTVQPGWEILRVRSAKQLFIQAQVHEADISRLRQARRFTGRFDAYPQQLLQLDLTYLSSQGESLQRWGKAAYYKATFSATTLPDQPLLLGMGLRVEAMP